MPTLRFSLLFVSIRFLEPVRAQAAIAAVSSAVVACNTVSAVAVHPAKDAYAFLCLRLLLSLQLVFSVFFSGAAAQAVSAL